MLFAQGEVLEVACQGSEVGRVSDGAYGGMARRAALDPTVGPHLQHRDGGVGDVALHLPWRVRAEAEGPPEDGVGGACVGDDHDLLAAVLPDRLLAEGRHPQREVAQGFTALDPHVLRPPEEEVGPLLEDLLGRQGLQGSQAELGQALVDHGLEAQSLRDGPRGLRRASKGAGVERRRATLGSQLGGDGLRLAASKSAQRRVLIVGAALRPRLAVPD